MSTKAETDQSSFFGLLLNAHLEMAAHLKCIRVLVVPACWSAGAY